MDAENARDRARQRLVDVGFYKRALQNVTETVVGYGSKPATWTMLPGECDLNGWPFDVTDPEETENLQCRTVLELDPLEQVALITIHGKTRVVKGTSEVLDKLIETFAE